MNIICRELIILMMVVLFSISSLGYASEDLGKFDYRDPDKSPTTKQENRDKIFDNLVEQYEAIRFEREEIMAKVEASSGDQQADLKKKLAELDKRSKTIDEKLKSIDP